jgi:hypothetical protein
MEPLNMQAVWHIKVAAIKIMYNARNLESVWAETDVFVALIPATI